MKKVLSLVLAVVLCTGCLCLFNSCANQNKSIYFLNFKPENAAAYEEISKAYQNKTGISLRVVTAASGTYEQTLKSEIGKSEAPVLFQINGPVGYAAWKDYCRDLSDTAFYQHLSDKSLAIREGDGVYGVPYVVEGYGIIYNQKIMDAYFSLPIRGTSFTSMDQINSFSKLKELTEDMTKHKKELGIDGVFACTSLKSGEDWRWQTHLANVALYYEFLDKGVDLTDPADYQKVDFSYSDQFKQLFDLYINNSTTDPKLLGSKQVADSMAEFALGKCAMVQNGNWAYAQIKDVAGNTAKPEDVHFLPLYMDVQEEEYQGLCIGTENYFAINKNVSEEKQQMALDFLEWLYTSEEGKSFVTNELDFIAPFDTFTEGDRPKDPLGKEVSQWLEKPEIYQIPWVFTVFPGQNFKSDFGAALLQYAQGNLSWADVKKTMITRWAKEYGS